MKKVHTLYKLDENGSPEPVDLADPQNAIDWGDWRRTQWDLTNERFVEVCNAVSTHARLK